LGLLTLAAIDWRASLQWTFAANVTVAQNDTTFASNGAWLVTTLTDQWPLLWLAVVGAVLLYRTPQRLNLLISLTWFGATVAIFLVWSPLWEHYRLFVALPLIPLAAGGLAQLGQLRSKLHTRPFALLSLLMLIGLSLFLFERWQKTEPRLLAGSRQWTADHRAAQAFLEANDTTFGVTEGP
jgi:hypothetical protein